MDSKHNPDNNKARLDFNGIAPYYDALTQMFPGKAYVKAQQYLLSYIPARSRILLLGGGSGELLVSILTSCQIGEVYYVEASKVMMRKCQKRVANLPKALLSRIKWYLGDQTQIESDIKFDVIITPYVLDMYPTELLKNVINHLNTLLKKMGLWLYTDFVPPSNHLSFHGIFQYVMYSFFRMVSLLPARQMPDTHSLFLELGYREIAQSRFFFNGIESVIYQKNCDHR